MPFSAFTMVLLSSIYAMKANNVQHGTNETTTTESWYYTYMPTLEPFYKKSDYDLHLESAVRNGSKMATPMPIDPRPVYVWSEVAGPTIEPYVYAWQTMYSPKWELAKRRWEWDYQRNYSLKKAEAYQKKYSDAYNPLMWTDERVLNHKEWVKYAATPNLSEVVGSDEFGSLEFLRPSTDKPMTVPPWVLKRKIHPLYRHLTTSEGGSTYDPRVFK